MGAVLIHAKLAGSEAETKLLAAARNFRQRKHEIASQEAHIAKAVSLLEALRSMDGETFTAGDAAAKLGSSEAWATTFGKIRSSSDPVAVARQRAVKVGYFLNDFRLKSSPTRDGKAYHRKLAIETIEKHIPPVEVVEASPAPANSSQF